MSVTYKDWERVTLGELLQIKHGFAFKGEHFSDSPGEIVLTPGNFEACGGIKLRPGKDRSYLGQFPVEFRLVEGDLLVVMTDLTQEANILGAPAVVPKGLSFLHNQRLGKVIDLDVRRIDRQFLYCIFNSQPYRNQLRATASGATVRHTSPSRIYEHAISLPPLEEQRRIASILGAYDDLIEVNRQRMVLLEGMSRRLFEEWFVQFRFPGYESGEIVDTPEGPRPAAWRHVRLDDLLVLQRGFDLPSSARSPGSFFVISASGRHGAHSEAKVKGPGVVTGRSGTIGKVHLVFEDHWPLNTTLYVKKFKRGGPAFAYQLLKHLDLASSSSGAAVPTLNRNHVHGLPIAVPTGDILDRFEELGMCWLRLARNLESQIERLAASRDLLLPRLISGQLSVRDAEGELQEAA